MYRARAEAVSGTRVYADGKWLQCIGNKKVSVGDRIWTDGRCVYGNEIEAQQPQIITAPQIEDESIPIIVRGGLSLDDNYDATRKWWLYTFSKNKLKRVAAVFYEKNKFNLYVDQENELSFVKTIPNTDKWTDFSLMINDTKGKILLYDTGTHFKGYSFSDANSYVTDKKLIATNIDKAGNRFDMVIRYASEWVTSEGIQERNIYESAVEIFKNGKVVKNIDIQNIANEVVSDCPDAEPCYEPSQGNVYNTYFSGEISDAFIENEQRWCFWLSCNCRKETYLNDDPSIYPTGVLPIRVNDFDCNNLLRLYLITNENNTVVSQTASRREFVWESGIPDWGNAHSVIVSLEKTFTPQKKILIQDGYFYKIHDIFEHDRFKEAIRLKNIARITLHSPNGTELFAGICYIPATLTFCRVNGKYLFGVGSGAGLIEDENTPAFNHGLYLRSDGQWKNLITNIELNWHFLNQRLRPMKKIKGWANRLQQIELEQHEI